VRLVIRIHYEVKFCFRVLTHNILTRFNEHVGFVYLLIYLWIEGFHPNSAEVSKASKGMGFQYMPQM